MRRHPPAPTFQAHHHEIIVRRKLLTPPSLRLQRSATSDTPLPDSTTTDPRPHLRFAQFDHALPIPTASIFPRPPASRRSTTTPQFDRPTSAARALSPVTSPLQFQRHSTINIARGVRGLALGSSTSYRCRALDQASQFDHASQYAGACRRGTPSGSSNARRNLNTPLAFMVVVPRRQPPHLCPAIQPRQ